MNALRIDAPGLLIAAGCLAMSVAQRRLSSAGARAAPPHRRRRGRAPAGRRKLGAAHAGAAAGAARRRARGAVADRRAARGGARSPRGCERARAARPVRAAPGRRLNRPARARRARARPRSPPAGSCAPGANSPSTRAAEAAADQPRAGGPRAQQLLDGRLDRRRGDLVEIAQARVRGAEQRRERGQVALAQRLHRREHALVLAEDVTGAALQRLGQLGELLGARLAQRARRRAAAGLGALLAALVVAGARVAVALAGVGDREAPAAAARAARAPPRGCGSRSAGPHRARRTGSRAGRAARCARPSTRSRPASTGAPARRGGCAARRRPPGAAAAVRAARGTGDGQRGRGGQAGAARARAADLQARAERAAGRPRRARRRRRARTRASPRRARGRRARSCRARRGRARAPRPLVRVRAVECHGADRDALLDRERQREALVVVGVLADHVDAARGEGGAAPTPPRPIASRSCSAASSGSDVADERAGALLGAGEELELLGGAQRRVELDVQVALAASRLRPPRRSAPGGRPSRTASVARTGRRSRGSAAAGRRRAAAAPQARSRAASGGARASRGALRTASGRLRGRRRPPPRSRTARACRQSRSRSISTQGAQPPRRSSAACSSAGDRRQERVAVDLPVRVVQRDADLDAAVLEDVDVLDVLARAELRVAVAPHPHQRLGALGRQRAERAVVVVGVDDHLGRAARRLERREAVVEDDDLEALERDLGLRAARAAWGPAGSARGRAGRCGPGGGSRRRPARRAAR